MNVYDYFRDLMVFGCDIGMVDAAHMYENGFCEVKGKDKEGNDFTLTLTIKHKQVCEKINEEENEK